MAEITKRKMAWVGVRSRQSLPHVINVGIQNTLQGNQGNPTQSVVRSMVMATLKGTRLAPTPRGRKINGETHDLHAGRHIYLRRTRGEGRIMNSQDARPTACRNASPADWGAESFANVPAFIAANTFAGFVPDTPCCGGAAPPKPFPLP
jgi:hypothetical protein